MTHNSAVAWTLRPAETSDAEWLVGLKFRVLFPDLERLGVWNPERSRERTLRDFQIAGSRVILVDGEPVGFVAVRGDSDTLWIEKFYIEQQFQGRGIGGQVLRWVLAEFADHRPFRINVLQGSDARPLYERHGFVFEHQDDIDVFLVRPLA
jgi:GNAT superfamily N-acetyltransferase